MAYTITTFSGQYRASYQAVAVVGYTVDINTGLNEISYAQATVKTTQQQASEAGYVTVNFGADGLVDLYAWTDLGAAAVLSATVLVLAIGT